MLNEQQITHFHEQGFLVLPSVLDREPIAALRSAAERIVDALTRLEGRSEEPDSLDQILAQAS